jgi:DNA-binding transcriptional LysR family regulator
LQANHLRPILAAYPPPAINIYGLYPVNRHLSAKVTRLVEFLANTLAQGQP